MKWLIVYSGQVTLIF